MTITEAIDEGYTPVNIIVGRFQPLTDGHVKCAEEIYKATGIKSMLLIVNTPENKVHATKPFPSEKLKFMYANLLTKKSLECIEGFITVTNADIVVNHSMLMKNGYIAVSWSCGSDRFAQYKKMCQDYAEKAQLPNNFVLHEIIRTKKDVSATAIRYAIAEGDFKYFLKHTPFKYENRGTARKWFDYMMVSYAKVLNNFSFK